MNWKVVEKYFDSNRYFVTKHHLDSFNEFVEHIIPKVVQSMNPVVVYKYDDNKNLRHKIEVFVGGEAGNQLYFDKPMFQDRNGRSRLLMPNDARLNDITYSSGLYGDILIRYHNAQINKVNEDLLENVRIGSIPIMTHSKMCSLKDQPADVVREMGECPYDQGGYFVVDGKEKVILSQERNITNQLFVNRLHNDTKFRYKGFIRCTAEKTSVFPKTINFYVYGSDFADGKMNNAIVVQIPQIDGLIPLFILFRALGVESDKTILQTILPELESETSRLMLGFLMASITDSNAFYTQKAAIDWIARYTDYKSRENVIYILRKNLFANLDDFQDTQVSFSTKAVFLGHVVNHLVKVCLGIEKETDRDNYMFKRLGISGFLLGDIFKDFYNQFRNKLRNELDKMYEQGSWQEVEELNKAVNEYNKAKLFDPNLITSGLVRSLKGQWGIDRLQQGIVQDLSRVSYMSFISHMRRVSSPMDPSIKIRSPHQLNTSQYGIMCPCESPDGASIGLIKNFAMLCHVTFYVPSQSIIDAIGPFKDEMIFMNQISSSVPAGMTKLSLNNTWIALIPSNRARTLVQYLKLLRRNALINIFTSISWNITTNYINVLTESGRCTRPLFTVDEATQTLNIWKHTDIIKALRSNKPLSNWYSLAKGKTLADSEFSIYDLTFKDPYKVFRTQDFSEIMAHLTENQAPLEFIDVEECNTCMIAMTLRELTMPNKDKQARYTHCEIHPSLMFSVYTATIPMANHNHAPRNIFSGAQGKQAIGIYATNFNNRIDTMSYVLHYPQKRIVKTRYAELLNVNQMPNGENLIVAICSYTGYNQEDSIIFNKDSIDRGMFNITYYKSFISEEQDGDPTKTPKRVVFANPVELKKQGKAVDMRREANFAHIDSYGMPQLNAYIDVKDALVGKVEIFRESKKEVNSLLVNANEQYKETITNVSDVADKTISGHVDKVYVYEKSDGQRAVKIKLRKFRQPELGDKAASAHGQKGVCGLILPAASMPFSKDGLVPDIIINPHAFPSRGSIAHVLECLISKACIVEGFAADATPFDENDMGKFMDILLKNGYQDQGDEILYNGFTGEQMQTEIFFGPTYYHRLKHMVADKINARTVGKRVGLTMQPTKGRSNEGGLRIGEMEANVLISHGIAGFMKESFMERSDKHEFTIDNETGGFVPVNEEKDMYNGVTDYSKVELPYAFKLLTQELNAMSIMPRLVTHDEAQEIEDFEDEDVLPGFEEDGAASDDDQAT